MSKQVCLPDEFELKTTRRYRRQNMAKAMRGRIDRGLVELITNSDDSYRGLEETGACQPGKIRIQIERRRVNQPSIVKVMDRASGMSAYEMRTKLGSLGEQTSGFSEGKTRRGFYGRGAKDVATFGTTHFESVKDDKYSHLVINPSLRCRFEAKDQATNSEIRKNLGISRGNGTVVTIEVDSGFRIPLHENLVDILSRYYSLRDIMSNQKREITLSDSNSGVTEKLKYSYPEGIVVFDHGIDVPGYPNAKPHLLIRQNETPFSDLPLPLREGILIKSGASIHDCTYFQLETDPITWRFSGELTCDFLDTLIREYEEIENRSDHPIHPATNPILLIDPNRDGLVDDHPFVQSLKQVCRKQLRCHVDKLKESETKPKKRVVDENLSRKLDTLSKEISRLFEKKLKELDEPTAGPETHGTSDSFPIGLHIIPPGEEPIVSGTPKVFTVRVVGYDELNDSIPVTIESSNEMIAVRTSPVLLKRYSDDKRIATTTFILESECIGAESIIDVRYGSFNNVLLTRVIEPPPPAIIPPGLSFGSKHYSLKVNREKNIILWFNATASTPCDYQVNVSSSRPEIIIKGGGTVALQKTDSPQVFQGRLCVLSKRVKVKGTVTACMSAYPPAKTTVEAEEREPDNHLKFKFEPDEDNYGAVRYKWDDDDPFLLKIAANHPSVRQYLGKPVGEVYPGIKDPRYSCVLAEIVAEALAFSLLERHFKSSGEQGLLDFTTLDFIFHRHYSDFLSISHMALTSDFEQPVVQSSFIAA